MNNIENEIFDYLNNKLNDCVPFKQDGFDYIIFYMYCEDLCRLKKMDELYGNKNEYFTDNNCVCLFHQDLKNKIFYIDYWNIWLIFKYEYKLEEQQIQQITTSWLHQHDKMKEYTIMFDHHYYQFWLNEQDKMKEYTTDEFFR